MNTNNINTSLVVLLGWFAIINVILLPMLLYHVTNLKEQNFALQQELNSIEDSQNRLIDAINEDIDRLEAVEKKLCKSIESGICNK